MSSNKVIRLTHPYEVLNHWPFFLEGMEALNSPTGAKGEYTPETFLQMLLKVIDKGDEGLVLLLTSKNDKPLGFGVCFVGEDILGDRCLFVWAGYTSGRYKGTMLEMCQYAEEYARAIGITVLRAASKRITGAAMRLFERAWGFKREFIHFRKDI